MSLEFQLLKNKWLWSSPKLSEQSRAILTLLFDYTLACTNINQSAPNLDKIDMSIISRMCSILDLTGTELSELSALEFAHMTIRSPLSLIMGPIGPEQPEVFAIELGKFSEFEFV